jgi:E3 ubiquitin-protein ligase DRIP
LQASSNAETSSRHSNKEKAGDDKDLDKSELWKPLNCLVDAASKTKSFRSSPHSPAVKGDPPNGSPSSEFASREKSGEHLRKSKLQDDKKDVPLSVMLKKKGPGRAKSAASVAAASQKAQNSRPVNPIWFCLIASFEQ